MKRRHVIVGAWPVGEKRGTKAKTACGRDLIALGGNARSQFWYQVTAGAYSNDHVEVVDHAAVLMGARNVCKACAGEVSS